MSPSITQIVVLSKGNQRGRLTERDNETVRGRKIEGTSSSDLQIVGRKGHWKYSEIDRKKSLEKLKNDSGRRTTNKEVHQNVEIGCWK